MRNLLTRSCLASWALMLTVVFSGCGGGGDTQTPTPVHPPPVQQWPQSVAFTDFTGGNSYFFIGAQRGLLGGSGQGNCLLCVSLRGIARSNAEMASLRKDSFNTPSSWPAPYNDKPYGELPIDYNSKMAVVLEDRYSSERNGYSIQKVEESAETITVSIIKCDAGFPLVSFSQVPSLGLLVPKSTKPIQVVTLPSTNPPVFASSQLGGC